MHAAWHASAEFIPTILGLNQITWPFGFILQLCVGDALKCSAGNYGNGIGVGTLTLSASKVPTTITQLPLQPIRFLRTQS